MGEPTFKTRILRRSGSYAALTKQINQGMKKSDFLFVKAELNKAIFENWYFNKFQQDREKKAKIKEEEERKAKEEEERKKDVEELSKEEFQKWVLNKRKEHLKEKKKR